MTDSSEVIKRNNQKKCSKLGNTISLFCSTLPTRL